MGFSPWISAELRVRVIVSIYHQVIDLHKRVANIEADVRVIKAEVVKGK